MVRKLITTLALGAFAVIATPSIGSAQDCTVVKAGDTNPVATACKKGGVKEAKKVMKAMVATAKKNGWKGDCQTCHTDDGAGDYTLTKDAEKQFKALMAKQ